jgi:hypothetical protein
MLILMRLAISLLNKPDFALRADRTNDASDVGRKLKADIVITYPQAKGGLYN